MVLEFQTKILVPSFAVTPDTRRHARVKIVIMFLKSVLRFLLALFISLVRQNNCIKCCSELKIKLLILTCPESVTALRHVIPHGGPRGNTRHNPAIKTL